jgi:asparagine synthase (glutamine-hydrolysing)
LALRRWVTDADLIAAGSDALQWPQAPPNRIVQAWGQISWAELFGTVEPMLLRHTDQMAMSSELQSRFPYLDYRIVEIALRIPQRFHRPGLGLLRDACIDLFPPGYLDNTRQDFTLPMASWMRGPLRNLCQARLEALKQSHWLDQAWITRQWQAFEAGQLPWLFAWRLVVLGEFSVRQY